MPDIDWNSLLQALATAAAAYGAIRVELRWLRRDTDRNTEAIKGCHQRLTDHEIHYHRRAEDRRQA